jgi:hypothetical protein
VPPRSDTTPTRPRRRCPEQTNPYELRGHLNNSPIDAADPHESALSRCEDRFYFFWRGHVFPAGFPFYFFRANISKGDDCFSKLPRTCDLDSAFRTPLNLNCAKGSGCRNVPAIPFDYSSLFSL